MAHAVACAVKSEEARCDTGVRLGQVGLRLGWIGQVERMLLTDILVTLSSSPGMIKETSPGCRHCITAFKGGRQRVSRICTFVGVSASGVMQLKAAWHRAGQGVALLVKPSTVLLSVIQICSIGVSSRLILKCVCAVNNKLCCPLVQGQVAEG